METIFSGRIFKVVKKLIAGNSGKEFEHYIVLHPGAVVVLPILPDGRIVLIRQHRIAVEETLIELPAGTMETGEEPLITARRELLEETGYRASQLTHVMTFYTSPGFVKEEMCLFKATELIAGPTMFDEDEKIESLIVTLPQAMKMIQNGEIKDAKTLVGLFWYQHQNL